MTVLTSESQLVGTGRALLPRVNLLPPEIAQRRQFRRLQLALGAVGVGALAVVGLLFLSATHSVSSAQTSLEQSQAQTTSLNGEIAKFREVEAIYAAAAAAQAQLTVAMGDEIRFSQMLNDLSLTIPGNVWITNLAYAATAPKPAAPGQAALLPTLGTLTVSGVGFSHDDVAVWLESIAGLKTYVNPYFSTSVESLIATRPIVTFASTAGITDQALSRRYLQKLGG